MNQLELRLPLPIPHFHCPEGCEHPQPLVDAFGVVICGRCFVLGGGKESVMIPCTSPAQCWEEGR